MVLYTNIPLAIWEKIKIFHTHKKKLYRDLQIANKSWENVILNYNQKCKWEPGLSPLHWLNSREYGIKMTHLPPPLRCGADGAAATAPSQATLREKLLALTASPHWTPAARGGLLLEGSILSQWIPHRRLFSQPLWEAGITIPIWRGRGGRGRGSLAFQWKIPSHHHHHHHHWVPWVGLTLPRHPALWPAMCLLVLSASSLKARRPCASWHQVAPRRITAMPASVAHVTVWPWRCVWGPILWEKWNHSVW